MNGSFSAASRSPFENLLNIFAEQRTIMKHQRKRTCWAATQGRGQSRSAGFQPAVSQCFQPAARSDIQRVQRSRRVADWKSAIQQVGNLRYVPILLSIVL